MENVAYLIRNVVDTVACLFHALPSLQKPTQMLTILNLSQGMCIGSSRLAAERLGVGMWPVLASET